MSLFQRFGVRDPATLEKTVVQLNSQKVCLLIAMYFVFPRANYSRIQDAFSLKLFFDKSIHLLQITSLLGRSLTGIYFDIPIDYDDVDLFVLSEKLYADQHNDIDQKLNNVKIRVLQTRNNSVLYAEVSDDFVDLLFGSLSIPLGSIMKTYCHQGSFKGCIDNLYKSIDGSAKGCVRPECQSLLLDPKAEPFSGCRTTKILQVEELAPRKLQIKACIKCFKAGGFADIGRCLKETPVYSCNFGRIRYYECTYCKNSLKSTNLHESNPKSPNGGSEDSEAYVKGGSVKFMVTDGLHILPLSMSSTLQAVRAAKIRPGKLL